jgi:hypothetical protein
MAMQKSQAANDYGRFASAFQTLKSESPAQNRRDFQPSLPIEAEPRPFLDRSVLEHGHALGLDPGDDTVRKKARQNKRCVRTKP